MKTIKNGMYNIVIAPKGYIGKLYQGKYCQEHQAVMWLERGIILKKGECIHHKNGNKKDNRIENLEIMKLGKHSKKHNIKNRKYHSICDYCKKVVIKEWRQRPEMKGYKHCFCSRKCQVKWQHKYGILPFSSKNEEYAKIIKKAYIKGMTGYAISKKYGLNRATVYNHINSLGV